jgi:exodeoxyribonuclease-3
VRIATWNVNSIRVRLPQLLDWLAQHTPDVVCLQETKTIDEQFPAPALREAGYQCAFSGQKTYNGVAILSRSPLADVSDRAPGLDHEQKRYLAATIKGVRVVNVYVPNGEAVDSPKYEFKLRWLAALQDHLARALTRHPRLVLLGDFNIAPEDRDVHNPRLWADRVLFSEPERAAFRALTGAGLIDAFRQFEQPEKSFSWWDYRMGAFKRNLGLRIDHILLSVALIPKLRACTIDVEPRRAERPSDHAPVVVELTTG